MDEVHEQVTHVKHLKRCSNLEIFNKRINFFNPSDSRMKWGSGVGRKKM